MGLFNGRKNVVYPLYNRNTQDWVTQEEFIAVMVTALTFAKKRGMNPTEPVPDKKKNGFISNVDGGGYIEVSIGINPDITFDLAMSKKEIQAFWKEIKRGLEEKDGLFLA